MVFLVLFVFLLLGVCLIGSHWVLGNALHEEAAWRRHGDTDRRENLREEMHGLNRDRKSDIAELKKRVDELERLACTHSHTIIPFDL